MDFFTLNNGLEIPSIGLGVFRITDQQEAVNTVFQALKTGYRHIDTASIYGNEAAVGEGIQRSGIDRRELFVTTKVWNEDQRRGKVREAFEKSLGFLKLDYVDLYLIHWPVPRYFSATWKALEKIYACGKAKAIGVGNFRICDLELLKKISGLIPAVNQVEITPYFQQKELLAYCMEQGIRLEAWGTFTAGQTNLLQEPVLKEIALRYGKTTAQIILRWNIQRGVVPLVKSSNSERQKQNLDIFDFELDKTAMEQIAAMDCGNRIGRDPVNSDF